MTPIEIALLLLLVHGGLGAIDTFLHHEWLEHLPGRPSAATELALHAARSVSFVLIFSGLAWLEWHGAWGWVLLGLLGVEIAVTWPTPWSRTGPASCARASASTTCCSR
jgi:hypothetical protein